jgi:hypothetical protein
VIAIPSKLMVAPMLALVMVGVYTAFNSVQLNLAFTEARTELSFWGRGEYQPDAGTIEHTGDTIDALLRKDPDHPEYLALQASYSLWRAYWMQDMDERENLIQQAVSSQYSALKSRPSHRHSWSKMIEYASRTVDGEAMRDRARRQHEALLPPAPD